jgi:hypothetical protein
MSSLEKVRPTPYGAWRCADGREVLYNRNYQPIWERLPDGTVRPADPSEWVRDIVEHRWFWDDGTMHKDVMKRADAVLREWGIVQVALQRRRRP